MSVSWTFKRWTALDLINLVAGLCLFFAPWYAGFVGSYPAAWSAWVIGALVVIDAVIAIVTETRSEADPRAWEWAALLLGVLAVVAPWLLGFSGSPGALWTSLVVGIVVGVIAIVHLRLPPKPGGASMA